MHLPLPHRLLGFIRSQSRDYSYSATNQEVNSLVSKQKIRNFFNVFKESTNLVVFVGTTTRSLDYHAEVEILQTIENPRRTHLNLSKV